MKDVSTTKIIPALGVYCSLGLFTIVCHSKPLNTGALLDCRKLWNMVEATDSQRFAQWLDRPSADLADQLKTIFDEIIALNAMQGKFSEPTLQRIDSKILSPVSFVAEALMARMSTLRSLDREVSERLEYYPNGLPTLRDRAEFRSRHQASLDEMSSLEAAIAKSQKEENVNPFQFSSEQIAQHLKLHGEVQQSLKNHIQIVGALRAQLEPLILKLLSIPEGEEILLRSRLQRLPTFAIPPLGKSLSLQLLTKVVREGPLEVETKTSRIVRAQMMGTPPNKHLRKAMVDILIGEKILNVPGLSKLQQQEVIRPYINYFSLNETRRIWDYVKKNPDAASDWIPTKHGEMDWELVLDVAKTAQGNPQRAHIFLQFIMNSKLTLNMNSNPQKGLVTESLSDLLGPQSSGQFAAIWLLNRFEVPDRDSVLNKALLKYPKEKRISFLPFILSNYFSAKKLDSKIWDDAKPYMEAVLKNGAHRDIQNAFEALEDYIGRLDLETNAATHESIQNTVKEALQKQFLHPDTTANDTKILFLIKERMRVSFSETRMSPEDVTAMRRDQATLINNVKKVLEENNLSHLMADIEFVRRDGKPSFVDILPRDANHSFSTRVQLIRVLYAPGILYRAGNSYLNLAF